MGQLKDHQKPNIELFLSFLSATYAYDHLDPPLWMNDWPEDLL